MYSRNNSRKDFRPANPRFVSGGQNQRHNFRPRTPGQYTPRSNQPRFQNSNTIRSNFSNNEHGQNQRSFEERVDNRNVLNSRPQVPSSFPIYNQEQIQGSQQDQSQHSSWQNTSMRDPNLNRAGMTSDSRMTPQTSIHGYQQAPSFNMSMNDKKTFNMSMNDQKPFNMSMNDQKHEILDSKGSGSFFAKVAQEEIQSKSTFNSQNMQIPGLDVIPDQDESSTLLHRSSIISPQQNSELLGSMSFTQTEKPFDNRQQDHTNPQIHQFSKPLEYQGLSHVPESVQPVQMMIPNCPPPPNSFLQNDMQFRNNQQLGMPPPMNRFPNPFPPPNFQPERFSGSNNFPSNSNLPPVMPVMNQQIQQNLRQPYQPKEELIQTEHATVMPGKEKDTEWIKSWLDRKGIKSDNLKVVKKECVKTPVNVYDVQEKTKRMMFLMASLQKQIKILKSCDQHQIEDEMRTTNKLKDEMDAIRKYLSTVDVLDLRMKVKKRTQKRERIKKQREEKYLSRQRELEQREQLHKEIDGRLKKVHDKYGNKRQQKELKEIADKVLGEIRKKTQDITRATDLMKNLTKLRKLRKDRLLQQGVNTKPESDADFEDKIQDCLAVVKTQKKVYTAENKALQVMLDIEQEENKEKEREKLQQILRSLEIKRQKKDDQLLFGESEPVDMSDPMFMFSQYYDQAQVSVDSLLQIRCDWDRFSVPEGTPGGNRIPDGFILPEKPSSHIWTSALKD
ncbi:histone-lysine N-methyltransferase, H3 lysine-79 specific-like [Mytilus trossulus]|uniref:histone-lysine N-methyltransferase, H3 lysine-79 specific-like n=1 Tax=Mytilus trossulus TaxID=6551 RepID=UPI003003D2D8